MDDGEFRARAVSFGAEAAAYAEHRPDYPAEAIRWAIAGANRPVLRVLDLAAGTGKLTAGLLAAGLEVVAVEPDPGMRAEFVRVHPGVSVLDGTAEAVPLPDATVDAVLVGQAFHWFDLDPALVEIARVLRPGGLVAGLWNFDDDRVGWVAELNKLTQIGASAPWQFDDGMPTHRAFEPFELAHFTHSQRRTAESLAETVATRSQAIVSPPAQRAELLARVRAYLESRPETAGEFDLPIRTTVQRARRR
jgi:SAM-dependent methyltransferase